MTKRRRGLTVSLAVAAIAVLLVGMWVPRMASAASINDWVQYQVVYDSGTGTSNTTAWTYTVTETGVTKDGVSNCAHAVASISGSAYRVSHSSAGNQTVKIDAGEDWRTGNDVRMVHRYSHQSEITVIGTNSAEIYFENYSGYPGWPYAVGNTWTYKARTDSSNSLAPDWTDTFSAQVVSDSETVTVGSTNYVCYKVVHTLTATTASNPPGGGVGSTITEYWAKGPTPFMGPLKVVDNVDFVGTETRTAASANPMPCVDADGDGYCTTNDCDDSRATVHPGATEVCNGIDDDCDGSIDEGVQTTYYRDADGDGYGNSGVTTMACSAPSGYVANSTDCNDNNSNVYPGATEVCNGIDDDCDGQIDEGVQTTYYRDADGDGYGNPSVTTMACSAPSGYVANNTDCDDSNAAVYPGGSEICDGADNNCDGVIPANEADADGDGYRLCQGDCDDSDATVYPDASELCDAKDNDCDGQTDEGAQVTFYHDGDGDGYGDSSVATVACTAPSGYVSVGGDCDDSDQTIHPDATEICGDGIDQDCNGSDAPCTDADGDGWDAIVFGGTDCDDTNKLVHPGATEVCNGIDDDCDGSIDEGIQSTFYRDADGDGYGDPSVTIQACSAPSGYVIDSNDCNDANSAVRPGATEVCNGIDDDCDGQTDEGVGTIYYRDADGDGYGNLSVTIRACSAPSGYVANSADCNDSNASVHSGATEVCNGVDDDCDGSIDEGVQSVFYRDADGDGYGNPNIKIQACSAPSGYVSNNTDCNDANSAVHPGATEVCNSIDDDCDGSIDEGVQSVFYRDADGDGYGNPSISNQACSAPSSYVSNNTDCDDTNSAVHPGATEIAGDGVDQNCDGAEATWTGSCVDQSGRIWFLGYDGTNNSTVYYALEQRNPSADAGGGTDMVSLGDGVSYWWYSDAFSSATAFAGGGSWKIDVGYKVGISSLEDSTLQFRVYAVANSGDTSGTLLASYTTGLLTGSSSKKYGEWTLAGQATQNIPSGYRLALQIKNVDPTLASLAEIYYESTSVCSHLIAPATLLPDSDGDGYRSDVDCNDSNASIHPGAAESCNGIDDDCDGLIDEGAQSTFYRDADGDGYGNLNVTVKACSAPSGYVANSTDCNDSDASVHPGATEICNGIDDDCDGSIDEGVESTFYRDADSDGYGNPYVVIMACTAPSGYVTDNTDCNDANGSANPGATEVCDGIDNDCDGLIDEGVQSTFYRDADGDGYGNPTFPTQACSAPSGYVADNTDCNDSDASVHPGATEICNGIDDDCDGSIDEGVESTFYRDADGDGYGNPCISIQACSIPSGYVADNTDCNDANGTVHPGAAEVCNGVDDDCDGLVDEGVKSTFYRDADADGYGDASVSVEACLVPEGYVADATDCDDNNATVNPGATEVCNSIDDDCDGSINEGFDVDGDGYTVCEGDCDDGDVSVNLGASEVCNGIDDDCDGSIDEGFDADSDGYTVCAGDCDDANAAVNPGASEACNGIDDDCDVEIDEGVQSTFYRDADADGYGDTSVSVEACLAPEGYVADNTDCDDTDASINPGATEVCNGVDDDCDGLTDEDVQSTFYEDADADGYGNAGVTALACSAPDGYVADNTDCDDSDAAVNPSATEVCNGIGDACDTGETVGDAACYSVVYDDGTNPTTNEARTYAGTSFDTVTYAELEATFGPIPDQPALVVDADFVSPEVPFRIANVVVPAPADILALRDWRSTGNGALLQEYFAVYSSLDMGGGPLGNISITRWYLWGVAQDFTPGVGDYYGYPVAVGQAGPMVQVKIAIVPGMDPLFWGEYFDVAVVGEEEVAGIDCLKVEYTWVASDISEATGTVVIEEWYPVAGDLSNPVLEPIKRIDSMNYVGTETQVRNADEPCPPPDSDGDGVPDSEDACPTDPNKWDSPGICGCGVADTDSDADGIADCNDDCPTDAAKTELGVCGCGVSDVDTDNDGTADCVDLCPADPLKTEPGVCGCGVSDADSDGDGTSDCLDQCPTDPAKTEPGICGCGTADTDSDNDGTADCDDNCPSDPNKIEPGVCGCGTADTDSDNDGTADCDDNCPADPNKTDPGICGCGTADTDSDNDGTADCDDNCPSDPNKIEPGVCGCGVADTDSDNDGTADCDDNCPDDPDKTDPGICGCGVADTDSDNDGTADCNDDCPTDAAKTEPGVCGCGVSDVDTDNDGTADCDDQCPADPAKTEPGICGCGVSDADTDGDGTADCLDQCPTDPDKIEPGVCGCGTADTDSDGDGTADCLDTCPNDPLNDADGDQICGDVDNCPDVANPGQEDSDGDGIGDACDTPDCANVDISVTLQGSGRPNPAGWQVPLTVKFFTPGANVLTATPLYTFNLTTTKSGGYAVCQATCVLPGTYDITAVSEHTLMNVKRNVVIAVPNTSVNMGTLLEGNCNNDTAINLTDLSILKSSWLKSSGQAGYDARADLDRNGVVNLSDLSLLKGNWLKSSPITVS